jgi:hypothetical protein
MPHSPHSSLSTPTPASLAVVSSPDTIAASVPLPTSPTSYSCSSILSSFTAPTSTPASFALQPVSSSVVSKSASPSSSASYRTPVASPSSSFTSPDTPARSRLLGRRADHEEPEVEDSDSSDVEIYLSNLEIDNSISRMQPSAGLSFFLFSQNYANMSAYSHLFFPARSSAFLFLRNNPASIARTTCTTLRTLSNISASARSAHSANHSTP